MPRAFIPSLLIRTLLLLSMLHAAPASRAQPDPVQLGQERIEVSATQIAIFEDPSASLRIEDVVQAWTAGEFEEGRELEINRGASASAFWARVVLANPSGKPRTVVLTHDYAPTDHVDIFLTDGADGWQVLRGGDSNPRTPIDTRLPAFTLTLDAGESLPMYLRVQTQSNLNFELSVWPPADFTRYEHLVSLTYGMLLGAILATALYLVYAWFLIHNTTALCLALYLLSYGAYLSFLSGISVYWLPLTPALPVNALHIASLGLLFGFGALFYRRFLNLAEQHPWLDKPVVVLQWLGFLLVLSPVLPLEVIGLAAFIVAGPGPVFTSGLAMYLWWRHRGDAGIFALGWLVAHVGSLLGSLRVAGVLPNHEIFIHLPAIGCAIAFSFFALAIARRLGRDRRYAYEDPLTGVANRRHFEQQLAVEMGRATRYDRPLSLVYLDVDHFKRVNDVHGHSTGDRILQAITENCLSHSRNTDVLARIGGEEFAIVLVETALPEAKAIAERLRAEQASLITEGITTTISLGVTELRPADEHIIDMMDRADQALYQAKRNGRNRVEVQ